RSSPSAPSGARAPARWWARSSARCRAWWCGGPTRGSSRPPPATPPSGDARAPSCSWPGGPAPASPTPPARPPAPAPPPQAPTPAAAGPSAAGGTATPGSVACPRRALRLRFLPGARDDASTLRSLIDVTAALEGLSLDAGAARVLAEQLLATCDRQGRLPDARREEAQALVGLLEAGLA